MRSGAPDKPPVSPAWRDRSAGRVMVVLATMIAAVDWKMPVQQAIAAPNLVARGANFQGEVDRFPPEVLAGLRARGIELKAGQGEDSGVHGVMIRDGRIDGGFDPRREGVVLTLPR